MVNMFMRQQYGIDMPNPIGQCLLPEIRSAIYQDMDTIHIKQSRG